MYVIELTVISTKLTIYYNNYNNNNTCYSFHIIIMFLVGNNNYRFVYFIIYKRVFIFA